jgi:hypothetical protein
MRRTPPRTVTEIQALVIESSEGVTPPNNGMQLTKWEVGGARIRARIVIVGPCCS